MELTYDRGKEFMGEFAQMIEQDYGITRKGTTSNDKSTSKLYN